MFLEDFYADLKAITLVDTFSGGHVYPMVARKDVGDQFITFTPIYGGTKEVHFGGDLGLTKQTMQVDIYSRSFGVNQLVSEAIADRYNGFSGELNSQTNVSMSQVIEFRNIIDAKDSTIHRHSITIQFTF